MRRYGMNGLGASPAEHETIAAMDLRLARDMLNSSNRKALSLKQSLTAVYRVASALAHISGMRAGAARERLSNTASKVADRANQAVEDAAQRDKDMKALRDWMQGHWRHTARSWRHAMHTRLRADIQG